MRYLQCLLHEEVKVCLVIVHLQAESDSYYLHAA